MNMTLKSFGLMVVFAAAAMATVPARADHLTAPVTGSLNDGRTFEGTLRVTSFRSSRNNLFARGLLVGTVTDEQDRVTHVVSQRVIMPIEDIRSESDGFSGQGCDFLLLESGPLQVELFDDLVQTDSVVIEIEADSNIGIIDDQLCNISDGFADESIRPIVRELNQIIAALEDLDDFRR